MPGRRDIAMYVGCPQVLLGLAPSELSIDPSLTYRLALGAELDPAGAEGPRVRRLDGAAAVEELNRTFAMNRMVAADPEVVTGVDHVAGFGDAEREVPPGR